MGQRHKLFIISSVGSTFRVLAGLEHSWLYGELALRQALRSISILSAQSNRGNLDQELQRARKRWPAATTDLYHPGDDQCTAFPFVLTCLVAGSCLRETDEIGPSTLPLSIDEEQIMEEDGASVFDITDPSCIRYAFIHHEPGHHESASYHILSAYEYWKIYDDRMQALEESQGDTSNVLGHRYPIDLENAFVDIVRIPAADIQSAWPMHEFDDGPSGAQSLLAPSPIEHPFRPLKDFAIAAVLTNVLNSDPADIAWIAVAEQLPGFDEALKRYFYTHPQSIHAPSGIVILARQMRGSEEINLATFSDISSSQILQLLRLLPSPEKLRRLVLPDMETMMVEELEGIIQSKTFSSLSVGRTPGIKLAELLKLVDAHGIRDLECPYLFSRAFVTMDRWPLSHAWSEGFPTGDGTLFPTRQVIFVTASVEQPTCFERLGCGGVKWSTLIHRSGGRESGAMAVPIELKDSLLGIDRVVPAMRELVNAFLQFENRWFMELSTSRLIRGLVKRLAFDQSHTRVYPLPATALATWNEATTSQTVPELHSSAFRAGEWTLLFCVEKSKTASREGSSVRHAYIKLEADQSTAIMSAAQLFEQCLNRIDNVECKALAHLWRNMMSDVGLLSHDEAREAIDKALSSCHGSCGPSLHEESVQNNTISLEELLECAYRDR